MRRGDLPFAAVPVAVGLFYWFGVYLPAVDPGAEHIFAAIDLYSCFLPAFLHVQHRLGGLELPLWNPYDAFGLPLLAAVSLQAVYPPRVIAFVLPSAELGLQAFMCFHLVLGAVLYYLLGRSRGRSPIASSFGAVIFITTPAFTSGPCQPEHVASVAWLPAVLLLGEKVFYTPSRISVALLGLAGTMVFLAGYPEIPFDAGLALLVALLVASAVRAWDAEIGALVRGWGRLTLAGLLTLGLSSFELLPFIEMVGQSFRTQAQELKPWPFFTPMLNLFSVLPGRVLRQYFLGGPLLVPLLVGVVRIERGRLPYGLCALFCLGGGSVLWRYLHALPLLGLSRTVNAWSLAYSAFVPIVAADALDWLWRGGTTRGRLARVLLLLAAAALVLWTARPPWSGKAHIRSLEATRLIIALGAGLTAASALWPARSLRFAASAALAAGVVADLWGLQPDRQPPLVPAAIREPKIATWLAAELATDTGRPRFIGPDITRRGGALVARVDAATGCEDFLMPARTRAVLERFRLGFVTTPDWSALGAARGMRQAMNLHAAVVPPAETIRATSSGLQPVMSLEGMWLLRDRGGLARASLVHRAEQMRDGPAALDAVLDPAFDPARAAVLEDPPPPLSEPPPGAHEDVRITSYREEEVSLEASVASPALLVLADAYYPGWEVTVDGARRRLHRANYLFRAVALGPGEHHVRFRYRPLSFRVGVGLSGATLVALSVLALGRRGR